jgi:uncharacterized membrane protein YkvA (DUF1232 family)
MTARRALPRVLPLARDARVPAWLKIGALAAAVLIVSPVDIFGDIPILGFFDDALLLALLINLFVLLAERWTLRQAAHVEQPARIVRPALEA